MLVLVARSEASLEKASIASLPQAPYDSTTSGMQVHPSSEYLASLAECFLSSAATAADPVVRPASERRDGFSGEVTERSKAAGLPQSQLEVRMSAGRVCRRSRPSPLPASALALMQARWHVWSTTSLSLLCLVFIILISRVSTLIYFMVANFGDRNGNIY